MQCKKIAAHPRLLHHYSVSKMWKQPKRLRTDDWIKETMKHIHNGIQLNLKRRGSHSIGSYADGL